MDPMPSDTALRNLPDEIHKRKRIILGELKERTLWFVRLRWWVPPSIVAGALAARLIGVEFSASALLFVAVFILAYNVLFHLWSRSMADEPGDQTEYIQRFTYWQVTLDYAAMFLLIHFTGGAASPFIFFFIFHIIFASILLRPRSAYAFAALAAAGMAMIANAEYMGWIPHHPLVFHGRNINLFEQPFHTMVNLTFFTTSVFITAFSTTAIMTMLRKRILELAELSEAVTALNNKLKSLYVMTQAIVSTRRLEQVLNIVTSELAGVMNVQGLSVKLLSEDGKLLRYAAAHGLPTELFKDKVVEVAKSPLNRRIIEGEPFVTGHVTQRELFQFGEDLAAAKMQSVLFVPLTVESRVTGILGAYSKRAEQFDGDEVDFFRLAAGIVAIALENARFYEEIEEMVKERSRFMMRVAHNLRAPLAATISILDVILGEYLGDLNDRQVSYLRRIEYPIRNMLSMINELMVLYAQRRDKRRVVHKISKIGGIIERVQKTFQAQAEEKGLNFHVIVPNELAGINCDEEMIEQMLENLVSNAIKYTPSGGRVTLTCACDNDESIRVEVTDNGIGIPKTDVSRVFNEFFRAQNARDIEKVGTGLGLSIVKEIVNQHGGRIRVESEEGLGTIFVVHLPIAEREESPRSVIAKTKEMPTFIDETVIQRYLEACEEAGVDRARDTIAKARELKGLEMEDVATLLQCKDPAIIEEMFHAAREVKESIYGKRLVLFAPLYISNLCQNNCHYCTFRVSNKDVARRALTQEEIADEVRYLERTGHKRILLVAGEAYLQEGLDYIFKSVETVYSTREGKGEIRSVNVNIGPLTVDEFRQLKACKIGTYQLFQETYHVPTYQKLHVSDPKADYNSRLSAPGRAFEGGINDVGIGVLFGMYDYRFEVLALLQHIRLLENTYGIGPHTISMPRLEPADGSRISEQPPFPVSDEDFKRIVAILRLAVPYTGIIMSTNETAKMRAETFALGVSQVSAGNRTNPGGYAKGEPATAQFRVGDHRGLDEVILDLVRMGYIPSFCTACYRLGRTGEDFMALAKPGRIKQLCLPNAVMTFKEYLEDYASIPTREAGLLAIKKNLEDIPLGERRVETEKRLARIEQGERDLYF